MTPIPLWRVFPWDPAAAEGHRFSAAFVSTPQGKGRFDLPADPAGAIYLAESEEHAVAEMIQGFRNSPAPLTDEDLTAWGHRLALVRVTLDAGVWASLANLCDPQTLMEYGLQACHTARRDRSRTQAVAAAVQASQRAGLRWWSTFWGEWHMVVLFCGAIPPGALSYGTPVPLDVTRPQVVEAARLLGIG